MKFRNYYHSYSLIILKSDYGRDLIAIDVKQPSVSFTPSQIVEALVAELGRVAPENFLPDEGK